MQRSSLHIRSSHELHMTAMGQLLSALNLSACASLRSLWLCLDDTKYQLSSDLVDVAAMLMDSGAMHTLRNLTIVIESVWVQEPALIQTATFSSGLPEFEHKLLSFPKLRCVQFRSENNRIDCLPIRAISEPMDPKRWEWLTAKLPELHRRGILKNTSEVEDCELSFDPANASLVPKNRD